MKKVIAIILAVFTMIGSIPLNAFAAGNRINPYDIMNSQSVSTVVDTWDGKAATSFSSGDGSVNNPYVIKTAEQLAYFAISVNNGLFIDSNIMLANHIDLSGFSWTPIGKDSSKYFKGIFNGNGYTISGLDITSSKGFSGLFGYLGGTIKNLIITVYNINISYGDGDVYVGAVAGYSQAGNILDVEVSGDLTVKNQNSTKATVHCGGIVGYSSGVIGRTCYNGNISVSSNGGFMVGGIAGRNERLIYSSHSSGNIGASKTSSSSSYIFSVAGGISGANVDTIQNCYSNLNVNTSVSAGSSNSIAGGIAGESMSDNANIKNCYALGIVIAKSNGVPSTAGGILGYARGNIINCYANNSVSAYADASGISTAGRLYGGNSCTVSNSYVNGSSTLKRRVTTTYTETEGSGCNKEEVTKTKTEDVTNPSNTSYTGTYVLSNSFIKDTLKWGTYVNVANHLSNIENTWILESGNPILHTERIYSLTINYHKDDLTDKVAFFWKDIKEQYSVETPIYVGYTADKKIVSGSIYEDTIIDVTYDKNYHYLNINYISSEGKTLGSYSGHFGYGDPYSHNIPEKTGYTARETNISGTMGDSDINVDTIYDANEYTLTIKYVYADTNEVAAEEKKMTIKYGNAYSIESPVIEGYNVSQTTVSGIMQAANKEVTVYYGTNTHKITIIYRYEDGEEFSKDSYILSYGQTFSYDVINKEGYTPDSSTVSGLVTGDETYYITYSPNSYKLTINYVYAANGSQAAQSYVSDVAYGDSYSVTSPVLNGYTVSKDVVSGTMPSFDVTETIVYGNNMYAVKIKYQYSDGILIKEEQVKVEYGTEYSIASPSIKWYTPDKFFISGVMPADEISEVVTYTRNVINDGAGTCGDNAKWILYEDGSLIISGQGPMQDYENGAAPWYYLSSNITKIIIEEGITTIGNNAFIECDYLNTVSFPESLTSIGEKAFFGCSIITDIEIPNNIVNIGDGAFSNCDSLSVILVNAENENFVVENGVIFDSNKERLICYPMGLYSSSYIIPETVKSIAGYAFYGNQYLTSVEFPNTITVIGESSFENCIKLNKIHIKSSTITIGDKAFYNASMVTLIVDGNISSLGNYAFACSTIRSAYFKGNVPKNVGNYVFGNDSVTLERLCVYYPLENESWVSEINISSNDNGYKSEYWRGYHAFATNGITDVTLENAGSEKVYAIFVYCDKTSVVDVEVTFNGVTKKTDDDGFVYFVYKDVEKVDLLIHKDKYFSAYESSSAYVLKTIGVDYFNLTTDSSVVGVSCYGNNISSDIGYINVKYEGLIPIVVQGTTSFDIERMELVQEVKDSKNPSNNYIKKVLQTVYKGDENLSSDGRCKFMVEASAFANNNDENYPIYVYMYTSSGENAVIEKLNIRTISFVFTADFENILGDASLDLSDTGFEFLDGIKIQFKSPLDCPLSFKTVNNEVYITWDLDDYLDDELSKVKTEVEGTTTNLKDTISDTSSRIKNYMNNLTYKADEKIKDKKLLKNKGHRSDFSLETGMAGGVCFVIGEDNEVQRIQSYLKVFVELEASWAADYIIIFVPVTIQVKATATGEIEIRGLGFDMKKCDFIMPDVTLNSDIGLGMSLGLGCRVISAGVFGRFNLKATVVLGEVTYFDGLVLTGEGGFYAKLDVGLFELYGEKAWKFMEVQLINKASTASLLLDESATGYLGEYNGIPVYDISSYALRSPAIDVEEVEWKTGTAKEIEENSYEYSNAKIIEYNDITMVMYFTIDANRSIYNAQSLVYRIYNEETGKWGEPISVNDNGTGDSSFDFVEYNETLYLVYTEANKTLTDDFVKGKTDEELIVETALSQEVMVCVYNNSTNTFENFTNISNNNYYDSMPIIDVINEELYIAWCTNYSTGNSLVFGMNSENNVNICSYKEAEWTTPNCILSDCNPISEMTFVELNDKAQVAMIIDEDANYYTTDDANIYIVDEEGSITFIDCYGESVDNLQTCIYQGEPSLVWYCNGGLKRLTSVDKQPEVIVEQNVGITPDYRLVNLSEEILVLTWNVRGVKSEDSDEEKSYIYKKFIDDSNEWTDASATITVPYHIMNYDLNGTDGDIKFVFTNTKITVDANTNQTQMDSKLCSQFLTTDYSFEVGEITNIKTDAETETISMDVELINTGIKTIKQVSVIAKQFYPDSTEIQQYYAIGVYPVDIASGESKVYTFEANYINGLDLQNVEIIVEVYNGTIDDLNTRVLLLNKMLDDSIVESAGGVQEVVVIKPPVYFDKEIVTVIENRRDLQIEGEYIIIGNTEYISLKVTNVGTLPASGMLNVVRRYGENNEYTDSVYVANIIDLPENGIKYYLVELKKDFMESTYETFDCWVSDCFGENNLENNNVTVIAKKLENAPGTEIDDKAIASELSSYNETFDKYTSDDLELSITLNGNEFVGMTDELANENSYYIPNADGSVLDLTIKKEYLKSLDVGFHEYVFLFLTEQGYIDCVLNLTIEDMTPIDIRGDIAIIGNPKRGEILSVDISNLNTEELSYSWIIDGVVISTEKEYKIDNNDLGKWITVMVSGTGLYQGDISSASIYVDKVARSINVPKYKVLDDSNTLQLKKGFIVGDGTIEYGWSNVDDANTVTNWSTNDTFTFANDGMYYMFIRITGSDIYKDAVSNSATYGINYSIVTWDVNGVVIDEVYKNNDIPVYNGSIYKPADESKAYKFIGWDSNDDEIVDIIAGIDLPAVTSPVTYTAIYETTNATLDESLNVRGSTLSIQSDISINYYISTSALEKYDEYYVVFAKDVYNTNGSVTMEYITVRDYTVSGNYTIFSYDGIAAKELNDNIYAIVYGVVNSELYMSKTDIYSVATYAYNRILNSTDEKMVQLAITLLNYGASAQEYFHYNESNLTNKSLTEEQKNISKEELELNSVKEYITPNNALVLFTGSSLSLEDKVAINYYFNIDKYSLAGYDLKDLSLVVKYGDNKAVYGSEEFILSSSNGYYVNFDNLVAKDMKTTCEATFWFGYDTEKQEIIGETMIYSIESYAQSKQNSSDEALVAMMKSMMHYGEAAYQYAASH